MIKFVVAWVTTGGTPSILFDYGLDTVEVEDSPRDSARMRASMAFRDRMEKRLRANDEWDLEIRPSFTLKRVEKERWWTIDEIAERVQERYPEKSRKNVADTLWRLETL